MSLRGGFPKKETDFGFPLGTDQSKSFQGFSVSMAIGSFLTIMTLSRLIAKLLENFRRFLRAIATSPQTTLRDESVGSFRESSASKGARLQDVLT
jgi:hypothetical protein